MSWPITPHRGRGILKSDQLGIVHYLLVMVVEVNMYRLIHRALLLFIFLCMIGISSAKENPGFVGEMITSLPAPTIIDITICE